MTAAIASRTSAHPVPGARGLAALESELAALRERVEAMAGATTADRREERLSLIVFSGSLDRLIAAFVLATGAAAMGMQTSMFFTFWATAALRRPEARAKKRLLERLFGWMLPKGSRRLPLSQLNLGGGGPIMIRHVMRKKGVASPEEMLEIAKELGVKVHICSMSMDLLGMKESEMIDYPDLDYCGVARFLETAAPGKLTLFV